MCNVGVKDFLYLRGIKVCKEQLTFTLFNSKICLAFIYLHYTRIESKMMTKIFQKLQFKLVIIFLCL